MLVNAIFETKVPIYLGEVSNCYSKHDIDWQAVRFYSKNGKRLILPVGTRFSASYSEEYGCNVLSLVDKGLRSIVDECEEISDSASVMLFETQEGLFKTLGFDPLSSEETYSLFRIRII